MLDAALDIPDADADESLVGKIPIRNVWLLFLYASGLAQFSERFEAEVEESPDLKSLIARLLCFAVEKRLRRNLSFGYRRRNEVLKRIRGRIDILKTVSEDLFRRGEVACRFDELTIDTPRNRLVRAALARLSSIILDDADLSHHCRTLANDLGRVGVSGKEPTRSEMAADQIARHEGDDRLMVSLARAVFDLVLPMEAVGSRSIAQQFRQQLLQQTNGGRATVIAVYDMLCAIGDQQSCEKARQARAGMIQEASELTQGDLAKKINNLMAGVPDPATLVANTRGKGSRASPR